MKARFTPAEVLARQLCIQDEGQVIGWWHPRAQERWRDFLPEAERMLKALRRYGYSVRHKQPKTRREVA